MAKDPAVLFYTSDFLSGTAFFNDEQRGQYIKLLCEQHQNGHIPDAHMIEICKSYDSPVFKKFEKDSKGLYFNERMEREVQRRISYSESRKKNRSGSKKEEENITHDITHDESYDVGVSTHMETETETNTLNSNTNNKGAKKRKLKPFVIPSIEEVKKYFQDNGYKPEIGEDKWHYYNDADWFDSYGTPVINWKQKMRSVWFKDENKIKGNKTKFVF